MNKTQKKNNWITIKKIDPRFFIFLFFLFIATVFWFLIALSKHYNSTILYPVKYVYSSDKVLINNEKLPNTLKLKVKALGFTILQHKFSSNLLPLQISATKKNLKRHPKNKATYFMLTSKQKKIISNQLSTEIELYEIQPDTLIFEFANVIQKKIPVKPHLDINCRRQFMNIGDTIITPDSVIISGHSSIIDTIDHLVTPKIKLTDVSQDIDIDISFSHISNVQITPTKIHLFLKTEEFTEASQKVPVEVVNLPDNLILKTFPDIITISYLINISRYGSITPDDFMVVVDYNEAGQSLTNKLKIKLKENPDFIKTIKMHPNKVEYIIEK